MKSSVCEAMEVQMPLQYYNTDRLDVATTQQFSF